MAFIAYLLWFLFFCASAVAAFWFHKEPVFSRLLLVTLSGVASTTLLFWFLTSRNRRTQEQITSELLAASLTPTPAPPPQPGATLPFESDHWEAFFTAILKDRPFRETAEKLAELFPTLFPGASGALYLHNTANQNIQMILAFGARVIGPNAFNPSECKSFFHAEIQVREEGVPGGPPFCSHMRHADRGISLCAPIDALGEHLGVLCLQCPDGSLDEEFWHPYKRRVRLVTSSLGLALSNLNLQAKFQIHSIRDPLTGMFNRRYLEESLLREVAAAERRKSTIGMILIYPDAIASYRNAAHPHASDQLLWELGQRLPRYIRTEDIPCRYDGDVLCVLLPGADPAIVHDRAQRICREVAGLEVRFGDLLLHTTLSLGVGCLPQNGGTARALSLACEKALVQAQTTGGNQVVFA